jgi:hypothetical protein
MCVHFVCCKDTVNHSGMLCTGNEINISYWNIMTKIPSVVRFQVLTAASMMFRAVFWVVLPSTIILHGSTTQKTALNIPSVFCTQNSVPV